MKHARTLEDVHNDPIFRALCPDYERQFMEARFLPPKLNVFASYRIQMTALIAYKKFPSIKVPAVVQMMTEDFEAGLYKGKHTLVVDSSGNTAWAAVRLAKAFGFKNVKVIMAADIPNAKKAIFAALSWPDLLYVGGGKSVAKVAEEEGEKPGHCHLNQYAHMGNMRAHEAYTGPEILRVLGGDVTVVAIALGSGGTAGGVGHFLKEKNPKTVMVGVRPKLGEQVPGARDSKRMKEVVTLPWEKYVDEVVEISRKDSFIGMRQLGSAIEPPPGPTSGLAWRGLDAYLQSRKDIEKLRGACVAFICPDSGLLYSEPTIAELDSGQGVV
ncbi:pyridoxal-phosphate dependent enzyme [Candidatus Kaiserbacteria bacterium]|nr:pyridoxal-phosphate dependent enzyme [Candidatus Kaiserbacteria bacterium]